MSSPPLAFLASSGVLNKSDAGIVAIVPFGSTTVAFPSVSYLTLASSPFNFFNFAVTFAWSPAFVGSPTTLSAGLRIPVLAEPELSFFTSSNVRTNSATGNPAVAPAGVDTVTVPLSSIVTTELGLTSRTAFKIFSFSASVNFLGSGSLTITLSIGRLISLPPPLLSKSVLVLTNLSNGRVSSFPLSNLTFTLPSWFTVIEVAVGFTFLTAASIFSRSVVLRVPLSATNTLLAGKRTELIALMANSPALLASSTSASFLALSIAASDAFLIASTSAFSFSLAVSDNDLSFLISSFLVSATPVRLSLAAGFLAASFVTAVISLSPSVPAVLISPWILSASAVVSALFALPLISAFLASAIRFASSFAAVFSSAVKSVRPSISFSLAFNAASILSNAACFAIGFTLAIASVALVFSPSTAVCAAVASAGVGAIPGCLSISAIASSAAFLALALATSFSVSDKSVRLSSASFLALNASWTAFLASSLATGFTFPTAVAPSVPAVVTASAFVASSILSKAACLASFTLLMAASFSACVNTLLSLIALICSVALSFTVLIAGALSNFTTLSKAIVSLEPSLYVTTKFVPSWATASTAFPTFLGVTSAVLSMFLSLFFLENSNWRFFLTVAKSSLVRLAVFVTTILFASSNALTSYLAVWAFSLIVNAPGSVAYELLVALLKIFLPSVSVAVA